MIATITATDTTRSSRVTELAQKLIALKMTLFSRFLNIMLAFLIEILWFRVGWDGLGRCQVNFFWFAPNLTAGGLWKWSWAAPAMTGHSGCDFSPSGIDDNPSTTKYL